MAGRIALGSEVLAGPDEAGAEQALPKAVHGDAGGEGMGGIEEPAGEAEAVAGLILRDDAAFLVDHGVPVEPGRDTLFLRRAGQEVAGELLEGEAVEGKVAVERRDHPVAPRPEFAVPVDLVPVAVGVARRIEPILGHPFAEMR